MVGVVGVVDDMLYLFLNFSGIYIPWAFCDKKNLPCKGDLVYGYFFRSFLRCLLQFASSLRR